MFRTFIYDSNNRIVVKGDVTLDDGSSNSNIVVIRSDSNDASTLWVDGSLRVASNIQALNHIGIGSGQTSNPIVGLEVHTSDAVLLAKGTTGERPAQPVQGYVRYNTDTDQFEGYGAGDAWGSLGGVKSTNQQTFVSAEEFPSSNDDNIRFVNSNLESMRITRDRFVGINTQNPTERLEVIDNIKASSNLYAMGRIGISTSNPSVGLEVNTTDAILLSKGTTVERPTQPMKGHVRYNIDTDQFEGYGAGDAWGSLGGVKSTNQQTFVSAEEYPTSNDDNIRFVNSNIESMRITRERFVGINTINPTEFLQVEGNVKVGSNMYVMGSIGVNTSNPNSNVQIDVNGTINATIYQGTTITDLSNLGVYGSNTAVWASNTSLDASNAVIALSNYVYTTATSTGTTVTDSSNIGAFGSNTAYWASNTAIPWASNAAIYGSNIAEWASNTSIPWASNAAIYGSNIVDWASNTSIPWASNTAIYGSNIVEWASNTAIPWASNTAVYGSNAANWASNTAMYSSNTVEWASNTAIPWASNTAIYGSNTSDWASNTAIYGSNTADWTSNTAIPWASNTAIYGSNTADWTSNTAIPWASNTAMYGSNTADWASNTSIPWASNTAMYGSNIADWASNTAIPWASNTAIFGSNTVDWASNTAIPWASNTSIYGSNIADWASNTSIPWASNAAVYGSNTTYWASNTSIPWASNTAVYGSNTSVWASNTSIFGSNTSVWASNISNWASNTSIPWASNAAIFGSNIAYWASNTSIPWASNTAIYGSNASQWASNAAIYGSNTSYWASNTAIPWTSNATIYGSNTAYWTSNTAIPWASNASAFGSNTSQWASNTAIPWASNATVYGSNTAHWTSNTAFWSSNNTSNLVRKTGDNMTYLNIINDAPSNPSTYDPSWDNYSQFSIRTASNVNGLNTPSLKLGVSASNGGIAYIQHINPWYSTGNISLQPYGGNVGIGNITPTEKLEVTGNIKSSNNVYALNRLGVGTSNPSQPLHVIGNARIEGNLDITGAVDALGGGKYVVQGGIDGTSARGIHMWASNNTQHALYMASPGASKSLAGATAVAGANFSSNAIRLRTGATTTHGIIFENSSEQLLASIRGDGLTYFKSNVSINTSNTPDETLTVNGKISSYSQVLGPSNSTPSLPAFSFKENSNTGMYSACNNTIGFTSGGNVAATLEHTNMVVTSNLTVGSNITTDGSLTLRNRLIISSLQVNRKGGNNANVTVTSIRGLSNTNNGIILDIGSNAPASNQALRVAWSNNEVFRITGTGSIGIGTVAPSERITIANGGKIYTDGQHLGNSNDSATIPSFAFKETSNTGIFSPSNNAIGITTNGTERLRVDSSGNVGIGTTPTSSYKVDIAGTSMRLQGGAGATPTTLYINSTGVVNTTSIVQFVNIGHTFACTDSNNYRGLSNITGGSGHNMYYVSGGHNFAGNTFFASNVGVGVIPSASYNLDVKGPTGAVGRFTDGTTDLVIMPGRRFGTNTAGWVTLDPNGGTPSGVAISDGLAVQGNAVIGTSFSNATGPSDGMIVQGTIGIGLSNPNTSSYKLDVNGTINATNYSNVDYGMLNNKPGKVWLSYPLGLSVGSNGYFKLATILATNNIQNGTHVEVRGLVGSWTNAPMSFQCQVKTRGGALMTGQTQGTPQLANFDIALYQEADTTYSMYFYSGVYYASWNLQVIASGGGENQGATLMDPNGTVVTTPTGTLITKMSENLQIVGNGTNVGIGTSNPSYKLDVAGNTRLNNATIGDVGFGNTWAGFAHSNEFRGTDYALLQSSSGETIMNCANGQVLRFRRNNVDLGVWNSSGLGIGTSSATNTLDVSGTFRVKSTTAIKGSGTNEVNMMSIETSDATPLALNVRIIPSTTTTTQGIHIHAVEPGVSDDRNLILQGDAGRIGIGTKNPSSSYKCHIGGSLLADGDIVIYSDMRLKSNITIIDDALRKLHTINGYTFNIKADERKHTGLIAQEVQEVLPEAVYDSKNDDGSDGFLSLGYGNMAGLLVEAIKEVDNKYKKENEALRQEVAHLRQLLESHISRV